MKRVLFALAVMALVLVGVFYRTVPSAHATPPPPCNSGYGGLANGNGSGHGLEGQGLANPIKIIDPSNCWTYVHSTYASGDWVLKNAAGNCVSWWNSLQRFVLADPGCNVGSENQAFTVGTVSGGHLVFFNPLCSCAMSSFTLNSGSELGSYTGNPIPNDEWDGIGPP